MFFGLRSGSSTCLGVLSTVLKRKAKQLIINYHITSIFVCMQLKQFKENNSGVNLVDVYIEIMLYTCSVHLCMSSPSSIFGKEIAVFFKDCFPDNSASFHHCILV